MLADLQLDPNGGDLPYSLNPQMQVMHSQEPPKLILRPMSPQTMSGWIGGTTTSDGQNSEAELGCGTMREVAKGHLRLIYLHTSPNACFLEGRV